MFEPRPWTAQRLALCFADRLSLPNLPEICGVLFADPAAPIGADASPALMRLLAGTAALLAGVPCADLAKFLTERVDVIVAAAEALAKKDAGWVYQHQSGIVVVAVHIPASFTVYLHIIACRISEELDAQAA